jgi:hypothetical protein
MNESSPNGGTATKPKERVSFSEVVRVHFRWAERFHEDKDGVTTAKEELDAAREKFELHEGKIVDAYWCTTEASAVALTEKRPEQPKARPLRRDKPREPLLQLHRVTDWITVDYLPVAELLHHCDTLAIKVECVLEGTARRVAMRWLLAVEENLLGFVERSRLAAKRGDEVRRADVDRFVAKQRREILQIEDYYDRAGQKRARQIYVTGMLFGVLALLPLAAGTAGLLALCHVLDLHAGGVQTFFACLAAGALGGIVSVLSRMAGRRGGFIVDHEIGRGGIHRLGSYRPLIGAIFGVALYFLSQTALLQLDPNVKKFPFFVVVAFLAGFSERWAQVVLGGAEQTVRASIGGKTS